MTDYPDTISSAPSLVDPVRLAYLGTAPERDDVQYPVTGLRGAFTIDHPMPEPQEPGRHTRRNVDASRTFFVTGGRDEGGFIQGWKRWRLVRDNDGRVVAVDVIFSEQRDRNDNVVLVDKVTLVDRDAYNFLKMLDDRNSQAFAFQPRSKHRA